MNRRKTAFSSHSIYAFLLFGLWCTLLGSLIKSSYFDGSSHGTVVSLQSGIKDIPTDTEWMRITHHGKKLGYSVYSVANLGERGYSITSTAHLNLAIAGIKTNLLMKNQVKVDTLFHLVSFDFQLQSDQYITTVNGLKIDQTLLINIKHGNDSTTRKIHVPDEIYSILSIQPMVAWQGITEGEQMTLPVFDPVSMEIGQVEISHEGKDDLTIGENSVRLNKIRVEFKGIPSILWLDDNGLTYREETIMGLVMEKTTPEEALRSQSGDSDIDLIDVYAIPVTPQIKDPASLSELILEIDGIDFHYLQKFSSERQSIIQENPLHLRLRPVPASQIHISPDSFLLANSIIQCNNPRIIELSRDVTQNDRSQQDKVNRLNNWVYRYLKKRPVVTLSSAVEILDGKQGDCSEHTTLFTSLSRSMGIPTKIHIGLVYLQGRFLYHAWPVVHLDGNWIAVDPTLGQPVADATHITLLEGDFNNLTELIPLLGRVTIRILEQKYEKPVL
ncbi:MAG: transglutaminase domain-containing protein [Candidatus Marinimicrobia bacterium]|nr:transglutaminase domain-containing protein [Candidatus Neomarinimicrobiota bacterium]